MQFDNELVTWYQSFPCALISETTWNFNNILLLRMLSKTLSRGEYDREQLS